MPAKRAYGMDQEFYSWSPIVTRPILRWPEGARVALVVIVNLEHWDWEVPEGTPLAVSPMGGPEGIWTGNQPSFPDIGGYGNHEYGNRVGFWRMLEVFDDLRVPAVLAINGSAIHRYTAIVDAAKERSWEFIGHGFSQKNMQKVADEKADIAKTSAAIREVTGKKPRGWLGPGLTETWDTPDLLAEAGYDYVCDWVLDDQPVVLKTRSKPIVNLPYTQECNDVAMMLIQHHKASEYQDRAVDQFEQLYHDARQSARVMALVVHPYIMGVPHRLKYFRNALAHIRAHDGVLCWTGEQILDWYLGSR